MGANTGAKAYDYLRKTAKELGADFQSLATSYAIERFMSRLSGRDPNGNITIKGGQSLGIIFGNRMRPTKDLDINISLDGISEPAIWIKEAIVAACSAEVDDGVSFDPATLKFDIREHQGDGGIRVTLTSSVHTCRTPFMIDIGIGNEITFVPAKVRVGGILEGSKIAPDPLETLIYPHENTLAEKIISKVEDGIASIRHKDFFDIWLAIETLRRVGDLRLLVPGGEGLDENEKALAEEVRNSLLDGTLMELPCTDIAASCLDRLGLALLRTSLHRDTALPHDLHSWLEEEFGTFKGQSVQWHNWCRNQKNRLLFSPPGIETTRNKDQSLMLLFDNIGPVLNEVCNRAHAFHTKPRI